jgi:hypothetical protein
MILMKGLRFEMFKKHQPGQKRVNEMMQKLQHFWTEEAKKLIRNAETEKVKPIGKEGPSKNGRAFVFLTDSSGVTCPERMTTVAEPLDHFISSRCRPKLCGPHETFK